MNEEELMIKPGERNLKELFELRKDRLELSIKKLNGNTTESEQSNRGFLFFNLKTIIDNIYYIDEKILFKYSNDLSESINAILKKESDMTKDIILNCQNFDDLNNIISNIVENDKQISQLQNGHEKNHDGFINRLINFFKNIFK